MNEMLWLALWVMAGLPENLNIFGLFLDIIGVSLIFRFGLPADIKRGGITHIITEQTDQEESDKAERYDRWALAGLITLIVGFLVQGAGSVALLAR